MYKDEKVRDTKILWFSTHSKRFFKTKVLVDGAGLSTGQFVITDEEVREPILVEPLPRIHRVWTKDAAGHLHEIDYGTLAKGEQNK